jgi:hypothetical protein
MTREVNVLLLLYRNGQKVLLSDSFLDASYEAMTAILRHDNLNVPNEICVFDAAVR